MSLFPKHKLKGYWPLDGYAYDRSGKGNHGTVYGATPTASQNQHIPASLCYKFNGSSDRITLPNVSDLQITGDISILAWIKVDTFVDNMTIVNKGVGSMTNVPYEFRFGSTAGGSLKRLFMLRADGSDYGHYTASNDLKAGVWYLVGITCSGTDYRLYVDGSPFAGSVTRALRSSSTDSGTVAEIGARNNLLFFNGKIQEVSIYNGVLTPQEMSYIYRNTKWKYKINVFASLGQAFSQLCSDSISISDSILKSTGKIIIDSITTTGNIIKSKTMSLIDTITSNDTIESLMSKFREFTETITTNDSFISRITALVISETIAVTDSITKGLVAFKEFVEQVVVADTIAVLKLFVKNLSESVSVVESFFKSFVKVISENISITDFIQKMRDVIHTEAIAIVDSITSFKIRIVSFIENISILDSIIKRLNGFLSRWTRGRRSSSDWTRGPKGD